MMTKLVKQPTAMPTNKLMVGAMATAAVTEAWGAIMADLYPPLAGEAMSMLMGAMAGLAVGYFVRDRANVITQTNTEGA